MVWSHSTSVLRIDSRGTTAVWWYCIIPHANGSRGEVSAQPYSEIRTPRWEILGMENRANQSEATETFSSEARRSTVRASAWTAPQSSRTLRMWRQGEVISVVKTNSGAAVTTCTSCPAATRCLTTCARGRGRARGGGGSGTITHGRHRAQAARGGKRTGAGVEAEPRGRGWRGRSRGRWCSRRTRGAAAARSPRRRRHGRRPEPSSLRSLVIAHTLFCLLPLSTGLRLVHLESGLSSLPLLLSRGRGASLASFCFKSPSRRGFVWFDHIRSRRRLQCAVRCVALRCAPISLIQLLMRRGDSLSLSLTRRCDLGAVTVRCLLAWVVLRGS